MSDWSTDASHVVQEQGADGSIRVAVVLSPRAVAAMPDLLLARLKEVHDDLAEWMGDPEGAEDMP